MTAANSCFARRGTRTELVVTPPRHLDWDRSMKSTRHVFGGRKTSGFGATAMVVLEIGEYVSSVWSPATGVVAEPSRVAVDALGRVHGFGFAADLLARDSRNQLRATSPFEHGVWHRHVVGSYVSWLVERSGIALRGETPVFLPLPPSSAPADQALLHQAIEEMGGDAFVIHRPLAAAVALGLQVDEPVCHLMAEVSEAHIDIAVIRAGSVVVSRRVLRDDQAAIRLVTRESLGTLDPDDELDILASGVHLYGWAAPRHAAETLAEIDLPLAGPVGIGPTVFNGVRLMAKELLPLLRPP